MAPVTHVDYLNTVAGGTIDNDVSSTRYNEAAMVWTELRPGYPYTRMIRKPGAMLLQPVNEAERIGRAPLRNVIVDLPEVGAGLKSKGAATHLPDLVNEALRCLSSSNTSSAGTT